MEDCAAAERAAVSDARGLALPGADRETVHLLAIAVCSPPEVSSGPQPPQKDLLEDQDAPLLQRVLAGHAEPASGQAVLGTRPQERQRPHRGC